MLDINIGPAQILAVSLNTYAEVKNWVLPAGGMVRGRHPTSDRLHDSMSASRYCHALARKAMNDTLFTFRAVHVAEAFKKPNKFLERRIRERKIEVEKILYSNEQRYAKGGMSMMSAFSERWKCTGVRRSPRGHQFARSARGERLFTVL
ncbi:unnamed protein product [Leptidea sinapis]|uniref:Uncharacterized protein n=1 Tax=Leptidea sinapis TaxID=189913 RepID=A0A5E4QLC8_9NEOP|nr:unnamed protein product [Leptidea sinapis]